MYQNSLISIIIPVYNVCNYIDKCVQSVIAQTYKQIEIILVDDGSTDGSGEKCDAWADKDARINVMHIENNGVSHARNMALNVAKGRYIGFVDADDYIENDMYEKMLQSIIINKTNASFCGYNTIENNQQKCCVNPYQSDVIPREEAVSGCIKAGGWQLTIWNKLFDKSCIVDSDNKVITFHENLFIGEDAVWLLEVLSNCKAVSCCDKVMYNYRTNREGSAVFNSNGENRLKSCCSRLEAAEIGYELLKEKKINASWMMYRRIVWSYKDIVCEAFLTRKKELVKKYIKEYRYSIRYYQSLSKSDKDIMFIIKSYIINLMITVHVPRNILKKII